ncbi:NCS2 family permease [Oceanobacillus alkalisoli]|uniref:NCS2 family permease n=1 Tax=Oceanobacillus alkalisoli TaxID=2925113 RepID=UPI001EF0A619|nr:NCS2 family permease [Oceanobacillus alkalisoli]MCF3943019.1 NCS2 family permease [Oceanobacillus alkalisoli]MCG5104185.1 NCS2 family permease [Oceanobacillus alkalisoli]
MKERLNRITGVYDKGSNVKTEILAGLISFFAIVYIIVVNATILSDAGIPIEGAVWATILTSMFGCFIVGFGANVPLILVPGMGLNAMFTYTFVHAMGLTWQEALAVVFVAGLVFVLISFTRLATILAQSIPGTLKEAITVGLGLFLALIGLEKSHIIVHGEHSIIALGDIGSLEVLAFVLTFIIALGLFLRSMPGHFLITIFVGTMIAWMFGLIDFNQAEGADLSLADYAGVFNAMSFDGIRSLTFWIAVFSLTMVLVFENIGLVGGQLKQAKRDEQYTPAIRSISISSMLSGLFGTSPTVSTVEGTAGIAAGGRTGITSIVTGLLFLVASLFIPVIKLIPSTAISPILIIIGGLMVLNIKNINFKDLSDAFPAFIIIMMIPFTYSIADGIAFGFIAYPIAKIAVGKRKEVSMPLYIITLLFIINFVLQAI